MKNLQKIMRRLIIIIAYVAAVFSYIISASFLAYALDSKTDNSGKMFSIIMTLAIALLGTTLLSKKLRNKLSNIFYSSKTISYKETLNKMINKSKNVKKELSISRLELSSINDELSSAKFSLNETNQELNDSKQKLESVTKLLLSEKQKNNDLSQKIKLATEHYSAINQSYKQAKAAIEDANNREILKKADKLEDQRKQIVSFFSSDEYQSFLDYSADEELNKIDTLKGLDFENYVSHLLTKVGFSDAKTTVATGDNGLDILAHNGSTYYGIQCKLYSNPVGNSAVQEAYAGGSYYKTDKNIVITNNYFTPSAHQAAETMDVDLWDRDKLKDLIHDTYNIFSE